MKILKEIKIICGRYEKCDTHCPFYDRYAEMCCVVDTEPDKWDIEHITYLIEKYSTNVKGKWIDPEYPDEWSGTSYKCSLCGARRLDADNYCGWCGARMEV